ncbi:Variable major outer membrane lipoprotein [Borrelia duttonii CR2A]|uniref:Variable large protein n=1 Tax=Borrelia duttonii CR2A TaxID=1432657 RepID=W6TFW7_9SPIR|nr:Variable major outer membrane lipoprotein [Borrelia duttonii CR2A]
MYKIVQIKIVGRSAENVFYLFIELMSGALGFNVEYTTQRKKT